MKRLALILLAGLLAAGLGAPLRATVPFFPSPDPWFVHEIEIDRASLPSGVSIDPRTRTIVNNTDTPLYLVKRLTQPNKWIGMLPNDVFPKLRLVNNELHRFDSDSWTRVEIDSMDLLATMVSHTEQELRGPEGPGRPRNAVPPDPVTIRFAGFFGAKLLEFEGVLSYEVLQRYDPRSSVHSHWFGQKALVITTPLPDGLRVVDLMSLPTDDGRVLKRIRNATSTPFHSFERLPEPVEWLGKLPDNVWPQLRLLSGRSYLSASSPAGQFRLIGRRGTARSVVDNEGWVLLSENVHVVAEWATWTNPGFELGDIRKDCRPANVKVPADKPFEVLAYLGSRPHTLRGRVRYALNPNYDPVAGQGPMGCASCSGALCDQCFRMEKERKQARPTAAEFCGTKGPLRETPKH